MIDYGALKALGKTMARRVRDLVALSDSNDPFYITDGRARDAAWFAGLWRQFGRAGMHLRGLFYVLISRRGWQCHHPPQWHPTR